MLYNRQKKSCLLQDSSSSFQRTKYPLGLPLIIRSTLRPLTPRANAHIRHCNYRMIATTINRIIIEVSPFAELMRHRSRHLQYRLLGCSTDTPSAELWFIPVGCDISQTRGPIPNQLYATTCDPQIISLLTTCDNRCSYLR